MTSRSVERGTRFANGQRLMSYERLEQRQCLAGDVAVLNTPDNTLRVTGDNSSNQVLISRESTAIVVQGLNGTTINGQSRVRFAGLGTTLNGLEVTMNAGNDAVFVDDLSVRVSVVISGGAGNDTIDLDNVSVGRDATIDARDGANSVYLDNVVVNRNLAVRGGINNDLVGFDRLNVRGTTLVELGAGNDRLAIDLSTHNGAVTLDTGGGADFIGLDQVRVLGTARINSGAGNDFLYVDRTTVVGRATVDGGAGIDRLDRDRASQFGASSSVTQFENRVTGGERTFDAVFLELERRRTAALGQFDESGDA